MVQQYPDDWQTSHCWVWQGDIVNGIEFICQFLSPFPPSHWKRGIQSKGRDESDWQIDVADRFDNVAVYARPNLILRVLYSSWQSVNASTMRYGLQFSCNVVKFVMMLLVRIDGVERGWRVE